MSSARLYFSDKPVGIDITDENEIAGCSERIFGFSDISDKTARLKAAFESVSSDRADVMSRKYTRITICAARCFRKK